MDHDKVTAIKEWPVSTAVKELQRLLNFAGIYRRFMRGFGSIARPLTTLLKKALTNRSGTQQLTKPCNASKKP